MERENKCQQCREQKRTNLVFKDGRKNEKKRLLFKCDMKNMEIFARHAQSSKNYYGKSYRRVKYQSFTSNKIQ